MSLEIPFQSRLRWMLVLQILVGIAPVAAHSFSGESWMLPAMWALSSLSVAQIMLLSFWVGMGGNPWIVRAVGGLIGTAYISIWPVFAQYVSPHIVEHESSFAKEFLAMFSSYAALALLFSSCFLLLRRKGTELMHLSTFNVVIALPRVKYSMFHLLVLMSTCSIVLSLVRIAQPTDQTFTGFSTMSYVAGLILMLVVFVINSVCAAWASLSINSPWLRIALAIGVAFLLGIAFSVASGHYSFSWWIFIPASLIPVLTTSFVILSLLVVRSCRYRLVPNALLQSAH